MHVAQEGQTSAGPRMKPQENIVVFAHIPKTAGLSIVDGLQSAIGEDQCLGLRMQKIENVRSSRLSEMAVLWSVEAPRRLLAPISGKHYLLPRGWSKRDLSRISLIHGHFCIGQEPRIDREPVYLSVVRDPVDRFVSYFYYRLDQLNRMQNEDRLSRAHPMVARFGRPPENSMEFLELLLASGAQNWRDPQVRYFSTLGTFDAARTIIKQRDVVSATMTRLDVFAQEISRRLGLKKLEFGHKNKGLSRARAKNHRLSSNDADVIRSYFPHDQMLYEHIAEGCGA
ncbi:MAG: sulfotransferase family 2 domain-containing protein [Hyphomicrobiaceae bacterium]